MSSSKRIKALEKRIDIVSKGRSGVRCGYITGTMKGSGKSVAVFFRKGEQIYRGIYATMSEAKEKGVLAWMLDEPTIERLNGGLGADPVEFVIMIERECGDIWLSRAKDWQDEERLYIPDPLARNPIGHNRLALKVLPVQHMVHLPGSVELLSGSVRARK